MTQSLSAASPAQNCAIRASVASMLVLLLNNSTLVPAAAQAADDARARCREAPKAKPVVMVDIQNSLCLQSWA